MRWFIVLLLFGCENIVSTKVQPLQERIIGVWNITEELPDGIYQKTYEFSETEYKIEYLKRDFGIQVVLKENGFWKVETKDTIVMWIQSSVEHPFYKGMVYKIQVKIDEPFIWIDEVGGKRSS